MKVVCSVVVFVDGSVVFIVGSLVVVVVVISDVVVVIKCSLVEVSGTVIVVASCSILVVGSGSFVDVIGSSKVVGFSIDIVVWESVVNVVKGFVVFVVNTVCCLVLVIVIFSVVYAVVCCSVVPDVASFLVVVFWSFRVVFIGVSVLCGWFVVVWFGFIVDFVDIFGDLVVAFVIGSVDVIESGFEFDFIVRVSVVDILRASVDDFVVFVVDDDDSSGMLVPGDVILEFVGRFAVVVVADFVVGPNVVSCVGFIFKSAHFGFL